MQLVLDDESGISIPLDDDVREAWMAQAARAAASESTDTLRERLAACLAQSISECLDPDLKTPTDAQLRYATEIARHLGVPLPADALRFRGAMSEFIGRFADLHRARRRTPSP
ncbi:hypothetical protein [Luteibacter sp. RCC_6_2]|uniref:hypothetical protein n=1 Tax=Luteibacter sp. RCC_6_2 TaxID=3239223 RepID=UPI0035268FEA